MQKKRVKFSKNCKNTYNSEALTANNDVKTVKTLPQQLHTVNTHFQ